MFLSTKKHFFITNYRAFASFSQNFKLKSIQDLNDSIELSISIDQKKFENLLIPLVWLRDHCKSDKCYEWSTNQRKSNSVDLFEKSKLVEDGNPIEVQEKSLKVFWRDGHHSEYSAERLLDEIVKKTQLQSSIEAWDNTLKTSLPRLNYSTNFSFKNFGNLFVKYGFVIVDGVEKTAEATEKFCRELGPIQNTFFGDFWVFSNEGQNNNHEDTAYGNETIGPHTDGTYLDQSPGIQVFHCLHPAAKGGNTVLTDGFKCAKLLRQQFPDFYKTLTTFEIDHHYLEGKKGKRSLISRASNKRVIETDIDDYLRQIRFNPYDRAPFSFVNGRYTVSEVITFYKAYTEFSRICHDHTLSIDLHLEPGSVIFIDNHRVFHSRTSFTGFRKMAGCYMSRDNLLAKIRPNLDSFII
ncbi:unnamed protein product [Auanema sp. JU1783]|nr:unnamed protein product [Auanema sp. JU1783]